MSLHAHRYKFGDAARCYEIQCVNGSVVGNYTADNKPIPLSLEDASPPYTWNSTSLGVPPVDGKNDTFPGNLGAARDELTVQCWNKTVSATTDLCQTEHI